MFVLKILGKFIKVLSSEASPNRIAWGFALGAIPGLTPLASLHNLVVLLLVLLLRVNISAALLAFILYGAIAWTLDPLFHAIGHGVLVGFDGLRPLWTWLYNLPIAPLSRFNNTVVMGGLLAGLALLAPNYLGFRWMVRRYRDSWNQAIQKWRITRAIQGSKLVRAYVKIRNLGG